MTSLTLNELATITNKLIAQSSSIEEIDAIKAVYCYAENYITLRDKPFAAQGGDDPDTI